MAAGRPAYARRMKPQAARRQFLFSAALAPALGVVPLVLAPGRSALAQPRQNLWVELRWVEQDLSAAAVAGVRDGAVVVGTGGTVSPRAGVVLGTQNEAQRLQALPRLMVLNGQQASITLSEQTPVQWVDAGIERQSGRADRVTAVPRQGWAQQSRSVTVKPQWPGGQQPVTVELRAQDQSTPAGPGHAGHAGQPGYGDPDRPREDAQVLSTVQVPLGQWVTVARSGGVSSQSQRGTLSTRDAETRRLRELQLRVDLAP